MKTLITMLLLVTIYWNAPTTNTDGTPLTDLEGYKLFCVNTYGDPSNLIQDFIYRDTLEESVELDITGWLSCVGLAYDDNGNHSELSETSNGYYE